jgi:trehalose-6-phosphate synthase
MDNNICKDFLNAMKNFVNDALKKCETEEVNEETVTAEADNIQVSPEDSIATTKGNEEKNEMEAPVEEQTEAGNEQAPVLTSADETDETEGDPDSLKNIEVPEEKSDEERLFETAEQLTAIAKQIFEKKKNITEKQASYVAKSLVKHAQRIAKYSVNKMK